MATGKAAKKERIATQTPQSPSPRMRDAEHANLVPRGLSMRLKNARYSTCQGKNFMAPTDAELIVLYETALREFMKQGRIDRRCMYEAIVNIQADIEDELLSESSGLTAETFTPWFERKS